MVEKIVELDESAVYVGVGDRAESPVVDDYLVGRSQTPGPIDHSQRAGDCDYERIKDWGHQNERIVELPSDD